jgi:hypothetical protein
MLRAVEMVIAVGHLMGEAVPSATASSTQFLRER